MKAKRGQMRILEALIACSLVLIGYSIVSRSSTSTYKVRDSELEGMAQGLLNTLEDQELILGVLSQEEGWESTLKELVSSMLPPNVLYNISISSLASEESPVHNVNNFASGDAPLTSVSTSANGVMTLSYPQLQEVAVPLDISLVIDRSGSMDWKILEDPENKIYYAKQAACNFVDRLNSTTDTVGLVSFATTSDVEVGLIDNHGYVKQRINNLDPSGYTNIGDAIKDSKSQFDADGRPDATWVMILLSDGKANRPRHPEGGDDEEWAKAYAINQVALTEEIRKYTIGLGDKKEYFDEELLIEIAGDRSRYFFAPSAQELDSIYQAIAGDLLFEAKHDVVLIQITLTKPTF